MLETIQRPCRSIMDSDLTESPFQRSAAAKGVPEYGTPENFKALQDALERTGAGLWSWNLRSNELAWSAAPELDGRRSDDGNCRSVVQVVPPRSLDSDDGWLAALIRQSLQSRQLARSRQRVSASADQRDRWLDVTVTPIVDAGATTQILGTCQDVTEPIYIRSRQQEALARLSARALEESNPQLLFDEAVVSIGDILGVEFVKVLELLPGDSELLLRAGIGWHEGLVGQANVATGPDSQAGYTLRFGRPVIVENFATEKRFAGQPLLHDHGIKSGISAPIAGQDGRAYGVISAHSARLVKFHDYDASFLTAVANVLAGAIRRRQLDHRHEMMIRELRHRSGNVFAQLLALFSQTAKSSRSMRDLTNKFEGRVLALATAHRLVTEAGWTPTSLIRLLNTQLGPHLGRVTFQGADVLLEPDSAFGLSMALHELIANACQHGSLSSPSGRVNVAWLVTRTRLGPTLNIEWKETGGAAPKRQPRQGFGLRVVRMAVERQLNGHVEQTFKPEGLLIHLTVPLTQERWTQFLPSAMPTSGDSSPPSSAS
jgi:two-component sensor histidine kinase